MGPFVCVAVFASFRPHYKIIVQHCLRQQINWDRIRLNVEATRQLWVTAVPVMLIHAKFSEFELLEIHLESAEFVKILM